MAVPSQFVAGNDPKVAPFAAPNGPDPLSQIGRVAEQAGGELYGQHARHEALAREQAQMAQWSDFSIRFAQRQVEMATKVAELRANPAAGGAGHTQAIGETWQGGLDQLLAGVDDQQTRTRAIEQLSRYGAELNTDAYSWETGQRLAKMATDGQQAFRLYANQSAQETDPAKVWANFERASEFVDGLPIGKDGRTALRRAGGGEILQASIAAFARRGDTAGATALLNDARSDAILDPDTREALARSIDAEGEKAARVAQHQRSLAMQGVREQLSTVRARISNGEDVSEAELSLAERLSVQLGDTSGAVGFHADRVRTAVNVQSQPWTSIQYTTEIQRLTALGASRTGEQDITLKHLQAIAPGRITTLRNDPGQWAALNGAPPPPLNLHDSASIAARQQWQRKVSAVTRQPTPFLQPQEVASYQQRYADGPKGQMLIADELAAMGSAGVEAARQIAPNDAMFQSLIRLHPGDRRANQNGAAARTANRTLIDGDGVEQPGRAAREWWDRHIAPALRLLPADEVSAKFEIMRNLYADTARSDGTQDLDDRRLGSFAHRALRGSREGNGTFHGGIGTWHGTPVLLPERLSQRQFESAITSMTWSESWANAPVYRGNQPIPASVVKTMLPVARPDGSYEFHDPRDPRVVLTRRDGSLWTITIDDHGRIRPR